MSWEAERGDGVHTEEVPFSLNGIGREEQRTGGEKRGIWNKTAKFKTGHGRRKRNEQNSLSRNVDMRMNM